MIELPLPDLDERRRILEIHTDGLPLDTDVDLGEIARVSDGWTGASLELVCKKAAILALGECREISPQTFRVADRHLREAQAQASKIA